MTCWPVIALLLYYFVKLSEHFDSVNFDQAKAIFSVQILVFVNDPLCDHMIVDGGFWKQDVTSDVLVGDIIAIDYYCTCIIYTRLYHIYQAICYFPSSA